MKVVTATVVVEKIAHRKKMYGFLKREEESMRFCCCIRFWAMYLINVYNDQKKSIQEVYNSWYNLVKFSVTL